MLLILVPLVVFVLVVLVFMKQIDAFRFIGFPLGYFLLAQGFIFLGFAAIAWHGAKQDQIDHRHGTHEDF